jgi:hypothetical protein
LRHTDDGREDLLVKYRWIWAWLISLNVGGVAHFDFANKDLSIAVFEAKARRLPITLPNIRATTPYPLEHVHEVFDESDVERARLCFIAVAQDTKELFFDEYIKGLLYFGADFYGIDFWKDTFFSFYRCFEHFVTQRILQRKNLKNELKEIARALRLVGLDERVVDMFGEEIYRIRSSQVMHAQGPQTRIGPEEAGKIKLLCDVAMLGVYREVWDRTIRNLKTDA